MSNRQLIMKKPMIVGLLAFAVGSTAIGFTVQASEPAAASAVQNQSAITVYKSASCSCCTGWVEHLERNGFDVEVKNTNNINEVKMSHQVPREMASCHTALIDGFVVEGHVPASDLKNYLARAAHPFGDKTIGISVPGMPHGTPGMETGRQDSYDVLAFTATGQTESVKRYQF